jgi:8-oxo-dGTP pyrophosphatase MutT (NUDIX family)
MPGTPADAGGDERPRRSAILVTRDDRGRVLLVRQRGGPFKDAWLLPGGGLEPGESFEQALSREMREETGLEVTGIREIARYDVRAPSFQGDVRLYGGDAAGSPRPGHAEEPVAWIAVDPRTAHPVLLCELRDAGVVEIADSELDARLTAAGIRMRRLYRGAAGEASGRSGSGDAA